MHYGETGLDPEIAANEQCLHNIEYAEKHLNKPWLTPTEVMPSVGSIQILDTGVYFELRSVFKPWAFSIFPL